MDSDRIRNPLSEGCGDGIQRAQPLRGRTTGPTRRSTKGQWTAEEDEVLRMAVQRFKGKNWKKIAECFKDRTDVQCLHRWQKVLNPDLVKGPWSKEEDEVMIELVNKYGPKKWSTIAQHLPGRIGKQCRERWHNHLNPNINKEAWTQEEELALIRAHQICGNKWAELTKFLPGRTDNSIKNHWNSSVKKKLDMYLSSGLLSQYQDLTLASHSNNLGASSSSKTQQSIEEDKDGAELESGCSQGSMLANISQPTNKIDHLGEDSRTTIGSTSIPCSEGYCPTFQEVTYAAHQTQCEMGDKFVEQDFSIDWGTFAEKDWQVNTDKLPDSDMSMLDHRQESSEIFMPSLTGRENDNAIPFPMETYMQLGDSVSMVNMDVGSNTPNLVTNAECSMVYHEVGRDERPSENAICDAHEPEDSIVHNSSNYDMPYMPSDVLETSSTQPTYVPTQLPPDDDPVLLSTYPDQFNYSTHVNGEQESVSPVRLDGFVYTNESNCSPCDEGKRSPNLVPANDFVLEPSNHLEFSSSKGGDSVDKKDTRALFYEPPRFPSLDIPFFSCDLIQSGSDMHQEYSPLGIRQLMMSSMTPFKLWDSPSRDDSPVAVLKSAAKSFTCTPSILRKRHRDLLSPLSENRDKKRLEGSYKPESFSDLTKEISCIDVIFNECMEDQKGLNSQGGFVEKENVALVREQAESNDNRNFLISGSRISEEDHTVSECSQKQMGQTVVEDVKTNITGKDAVDKAKEGSGILVEHDMNDLLFFSPDRFGTKGVRTISPNAKALGNQYTRRIESLSKPGPILSSAETSYFPVLCSPRLCSKKDETSLHATSLQSHSPSKKNREHSGKGISFESNGMYMETPFKRKLESPSAWKSPWFVNTFVPGSRVDTDITVEDIGYFFSPGDRSYDAIGLMKQLCEQNASAFADAQEVLGDETPQSLLKVKCFTKQQQEKENSHTPNTQRDHHSLSPSSLMTERRALDFSECGTPGKETRKAPSSTCVATPSSYLLKNCR